MKYRRVPRNIGKTWAIALLLVSPLFVFLLDSLSPEYVGQSYGHVTVVYDGIKIKSVNCHEVQVTLESGQTVLADILDSTKDLCRVGAPVLIKHFKTRLFGLSSYESFASNRAKF